MVTYVEEIFDDLIEELNRKNVKRKKNAGVRYKTPQELAQKAKEVISETIENNGVLTLSGLALKLGYKGRQGLYNHDNYGNEFVPVINLIRLFVTAFNEERIYNQPAGAIFMLKNLMPDYFKDKVEQDVNVSNTNYKVEI